MLRLTSTFKNAANKPVLRLSGGISNISRLAPVSSYFAEFDCQVGQVRLDDYPRWSESCLGLAARCLQKAAFSSEPSLDFPADCAVVSVEIGLQPGGHGNIRPLAEATLRICADRTASIEGLELPAAPLFSQVVPVPEGVLSAWDMTLLTLSYAAFGTRDLPEPKPLAPVIHESKGLRYIRTSELPEPARSVFERRMAHSTRPWLPEAPDAVYAWDFEAFLGGGR